MQKFRRLGSQPKAGRSHYQFKNWTWDKFGNRQAAVSVRPLRGDYADLVNTCYFNPSKGTNTLYCLAFDLDAHRAKAEWKTKKGKLKWHKIKKLLSEKHPEILQYVFSAVTSTGGNGLALYLAIRPLELCDKTRKAQYAAKALLEKLLVLFNQYGFGADPSAIGLKRDFCNWLNPHKSVYSNPFVLKSVQSDKTPVVKTLLTYLKPLGLAEYVKKSQRTGLLYPDLRAERKLASLYTFLHEKWLDNEKSVGMTVSSIRSLTSLSRPFVEKFLKSPPNWLLTEYQGRTEGWSLAVNLSTDLTNRSHELLNNKAYDTGQNLTKPLIRPEQVEDGNRNHWLTQASLLLKHSGIKEDQAVQIIQQHISSIPGHEESQNCKAFKGLIRNIYSRYQDLFAIKPGCAPKWLVIPTPANPVIPNAAEGSQLTKGTSSPNTQMQTFLKKGGKPPAPVLRKVSRDQCFTFKKNYYSLPRSYVGKQVLAFPWEGQLRVYDEHSKKHIYTHQMLTQSKGKYQTDPRHIGTFGSLERQYFTNLVEQFHSDGDAIGLFAESLVARYQLFSLRRLWALRGLINQNSRDLVNQAAAYSRNIRDLSNNLRFISKGDLNYDSRPQRLSKAVLSG
ncbi:MAG: hypothetical protein HRU09_19895 [Oligoflexales bacterium]|nr:hypothetical protein [Oligoflexales bacterium]